MNTLALARRSIPLNDSWDVVVAGGGPAGCAAAAAAAREGARTLLIEATGMLGGMGTAGLVTCWCPFSDKKQMIYRGLAQKVFVAGQSGVPHVPREQLDWVPFDPEHLKRIYDDLVTDAGVTLLFQSFVTGVEMDADGVVSALLVASKSGLTAHRAKVYVDCTGDGDVCAWAGAEFGVGDETTGEVQPSTHCFVLSNVDTHAFALAPRGRLFHDVHACGRYPLVKDRHGCNTLVGPGTVTFNSGHLWEVDSTDPASMSKALVEGRRLIRQLRDGLAEFHPAAFGNAFLAQSAPLLGVRESRRIIGDYVLVKDDYLSRRSFHDEIGRNSYPIDIHTTKAEATTGRGPNAMDRYEQFGPGESHGIPYRCLTPKGLRNVLVAGRCISTDHIVQASTRVMPPCLVMGEAAGIAAAMATGDGNVHAVDTDRLRQRLREEGGYLP
ncbi:MAG: putative FAD-binding dehydrogenase [Lentisphaerae bacterium ADurb.BinA184]|nr:MAG: putative FAD-binding dehydrogenase [Lentisphaerae bacterium ADurb.BinA184]